MKQKQSDLQDKLSELEQEQQAIQADIDRYTKQNKELSKKRNSIKKRVNTKLSGLQVKLFATLALIQYKSEWSRDTCIVCGKPAHMAFDAGALGIFGMCSRCFDGVIKLEDELK